MPHFTAVTRLEVIITKQKKKFSKIPSLELKIKAIVP